MGQSRGGGARCGWHRKRRVFDTTDDGNYVNVIADIPISGSRTFARLKAE